MDRFWIDALLTPRLLSNANRLDTLYADGLQLQVSRRDGAPAWLSPAWRPKTKKGDIEKGEDAKRQVIGTMPERERRGGKAPSASKVHPSSAPPSGSSERGR